MFRDRKTTDSFDRLTSKEKFSAGKKMVLSIFSKGFVSVNLISKCERNVIEIDNCLNETISRKPTRLSDVEFTDLSSSNGKKRETIN